MTRPPNTAPFVSVLMSCYNASRWLDESIQSVLNQSYGDFEFIIVDDGSEDDTLSIVRRYASKDDRIVVIAKTNTGLADSLNVGIKQARGEWIARLDADDLSEPERLEKQVQAALSNPALVYIGTGLVLIDGQGQIAGAHHYPRAHGKLVEHLQTARKFPAHSSAFYRSDAVRSIGGYRLRIHRAQDWDLWLRLSEIGELACLGEPLVRVRKHADQVSHDESGRRQIIDSRMAMISYWIRKLKVEDPVSADEQAFHEFRTWVVNQLERASLFAKREYAARLKRLLSGELQMPAHLFRIGILVFQHPLRFASFAKEQVVGETLTRKLAAAWLRMR